MMTAASGAAGLELLVAGIDGLAGVCIDVARLQLSGDGIARVIAERWPDVPLVLMSNYTAAETVQRYADLPQGVIMQKPFTLRDLQVALVGTSV